MHASALPSFGRLLVAVTVVPLNFAVSGLPVITQSSTAGHSTRFQPLADVEPIGADQVVPFHFHTRVCPGFATPPATQYVGVTQSRSLIWVVPVGLGSEVHAVPSNSRASPS
jgi:hypothetical protein